MKFNKCLIVFYYVKQLQCPSFQYKPKKKMATFPSQREKTIRSLCHAFGIRTDVQNLQAICRVVIFMQCKKGTERITQARPCEYVNVYQIPHFSRIRSITHIFIGHDGIISLHYEVVSCSLSLFLFIFQGHTNRF